MKMEKSYGHFVADVGGNLVFTIIFVPEVTLNTFLFILRPRVASCKGRNSIKKDHQLQTWIMDPNFQEASIPNFLKPFPPETLAKAFDLQPGVLPGVSRLAPLLYSTPS